MTPLAFFRVSLLLPLILPPLIWLLFKNMGTTVILMSVLIAGVPYLAFVAYLWVRLGALPASMNVPQPILMSPVLFLVPACIAFMLWSGYTSGFNQYLPISLIVFIPFGLFIVLFGYAYVGMTVLAYGLLTRAGFIHLPPT